MAIRGGKSCQIVINDPIQNVYCNFEYFCSRNFLVPKKEKMFLYYYCSIYKKKDFSRKKTTTSLVLETA